MLTFYFAPGSSSMAPHIGLHEVGAAFEGKPMSFKNGELRKPEYLAINPEGKVPTLVIDGRPLTEVAAILYYLAKAFPAAELLPKNDPEAEALVRELAGKTGETEGEAVVRALKERLQRLSLKDGQAELADQLNKLALDYASQPVLDARSADEILGYDENGLPR